MKVKIYLLLILLFNTTLNAKTPLSSIVGKANYLYPLETVSQTLSNIQNKKDVSPYLLTSHKTIILNSIKNISLFDISKAKEHRICQYTNNKTLRVYNVNFKRTNNHKWKVVNIYDNKKSKITSRIINSIYSNADSINCFPNFMKDWNKKYKNTPISLIGTYAKVEKVLIKKNKKTFSATFNLEYRDSTKKDFKNGWLIKKIDLFASNKRLLKSVLIKEEDKSFFLPKEYNNLQFKTDKSGFGKIVQDLDTVDIYIKELQCSKQNDFIQIVFILNKNGYISEYINSIRDNDTIAEFSIPFKGNNIKVRTCPFLKLTKGNSTTKIDLSEFPNKITEFKPFRAPKPNKSFINFYYKKDLKLDKNKSSFWGN